MSHKTNRRSHAKAGPVPAVVIPFLVLVACGEPAETEPREQHDRGTEMATEVHLDASQMAAANIGTIAAAPGPIEETLQLVARVSSNEDTIVHVTPRIDGIVQAIHKGLGEEVAAGDELAEIWSVELGNTISAYLKAHATVLAAEETLERSKELFRQRLETVTAVLDGGIAVAREIHERERELQEQGIATVRPYLEAGKDLQKALLAKDRELTTLGAERDTRLLELEVKLRDARIEETGAKDRLLVLGFEDADIDGFREKGGRPGRMVLRAPRNGVILDRHATLNEHVDTDRVLFVIHDLSTVWVLGSAYEKDLARLRPGQKAWVRLDALSDTALVGEVSVIDYRISDTTRSAAVRIVLENDPIEGWPIRYPLRPGMFGDVEVVVESRTGRVVVPESAIVHEGNDNFLFVRAEDEENTFRRIPVTLKAGAGDRIEILTGVDPGADVVVTGAFTLKSLARAEEMGEGHDH